MSVSFEVPRNRPQDQPPYAEGCPDCPHVDVVVVPIVTVTEGDVLRAFYVHGRCGRRWVTSWQARWAVSWQRVLGDGVEADDALQWVRDAVLPPGMVA